MLSFNTTVFLLYNTHFTLNFIKKTLIYAGETNLAINIKEQSHHNVVMVHHPTLFSPISFSFIQN